MQEQEKEKLTKDQKYYRKKKLEKGFLESRSKWQKEYREKNPEYDKKIKEKSKKFYVKNKTRINKQVYNNRKHTDTKVRDRIKKSNQKTKELITDSYVKKISRNANMTYIEIELKRNEILIHRINKQIKIKQNELQNSRFKK